MIIKSGSPSPRAVLGEGENLREPEIYVLLHGVLCHFFLVPAEDERIRVYLSELCSFVHPQLTVANSHKFLRTICENIA